MRTRNKKIPIFYIFYFVLVIAALAAIGIGAKFFWDWLDDYEHSLPKYVAEGIFDEYYSRRDFSLLSEKAGVTVSEFEDLSDLVKYMQAKTDGLELEYHEVSAGLGDKKKYVVTAGNERISEFTIKKSGNKSKNGFDIYELDSLGLIYSADEGVTLSVIKGGSVKINGRALDLSSCTLVEDNIETFSHGHMLEGSGAEPITYATYRVDGFILSPEINTFDKNGKPSVLSYDDDTGVYKEEINYDEELRVKKTQIASEGAEVYLKYMTRDASANLLGFYFDKTSEIYNKVRSSDTRWFADHTGYEFKDEQLNEFYAYSGDTFSCRYTCTHVINLYGNQIYESPIDITFYFREVGEDTLIYDLVSNN